MPDCRIPILLLVGLLGYPLCQAQLVNCPRGCLCTTVPNSAIALVTNSFLRLQVSCNTADPTPSIPTLNVQTDYLREFEFTGSDLQEMPSNLCTFNYIQYLDLSNNNISSASSNVFGCLPFLVRLQMAQNSFSELHQGIFQGLAVVTTIDFSSNQIEYIHHSAFHAGMSQLETVDLSNNRLGAFEPWPFLLPKLIVFDLTGNRISEFSNSMNWTVEQSPSSITAYIGLQRNQFTSIALRDFSVFHFASITDLWYMRPVFGYFDLRNNPFICDCHIYDFVFYMSEISKTYPLKTSFDYQYYDVTCQSPSHLQGSVMLDLNYTAFVCTNVTLCPEGCQCTFTPHIDVTEVDCRSAGLLGMPSMLPEGKLILHFQDNHIRFLTSRNYLTRITHLYLSDNNIEQIHEEALRNLQSIQLLRLNNNNLTSVPRSIRDLMSPSSLDLSGNVFPCDCSTTWLALWLRDSSDAGMDSELCSNASGIFFLDITDEGLGCNPLGGATALYITLAVVCVVILLFIVLLIVFRKYVKIVGFHYLNLHPFDRLNDDSSDSRNKEVYLSVHCQRSDVKKWVSGELTERLEKHALSYSVFLPSRDAGHSISREVVSNRLRESKRHLFILTSDFAQSDWPVFELRESALQEDIGEGKRMIIIVFDEGALEKLDDETKKLVNSHTLLRPSDRWFWPELYYWMPVKYLGPLCCKCSCVCCTKPQPQSIPGPTKPKLSPLDADIDRLGMVTPVHRFNPEDTDDLAWREELDSEFAANRDIRRAKYPRLSPLGQKSSASNEAIQEDLDVIHEGSVPPSAANL